MRNTIMLNIDKLDINALRDVLFTAMALLIDRCDDFREVSAKSLLGYLQEISSTSCKRDYVIKELSNEG